MATKLTTSSLTVSTTESITLNGVPQGSATSKTFGNIGSIFKRIVRVPNAETILYTTHASDVTGSQFDVDLIKYVRITNLDDANAVDLLIVSSDADEYAYKLNSGESKLFYSHSGVVQAHNAAITPATTAQATANLTVDDGDQATSGQYHAANHLRKMGCNIMYGHWHDLQQHSMTHMDGPKSAWSMGCLKDMSAESNEWLDNRNHNWSHAFAIVDFYEG